MDSFVFYCRGHSNVRATHKTTLEFTKDENLSSKGDCIIGVSSSESLDSFPLELKRKIMSSEAIIYVKLEVEKYSDLIKGYGNSKLELNDDNAIVIRKSNFICSRTLMINSDKAAININKQIILKMKNPENKMKVTVMVKEK